MKRTLLMVLLLLTGGAIINVAVAWGCARFMKAEPFFGGLHSGPVTDWRAMGVRRQLQVEYIEPASYKTTLSPDFRVEFLHEAGWPALALNRRVVAWSLPLIPPQEARLFRPIWPGFAINTIFYAAILWLLVAALHPGGFVRRRIRARRGQCPACAYPVGSSTVCTECGKAVRRVGRTQ